MGTVGYCADTRYSTDWTDSPHEPDRVAKEIRIDSSGLKLVLKLRLNVNGIGLTVSAEIDGGERANGPVDDSIIRDSFLSTGWASLKLCEDDLPSVITRACKYKFGPGAFGKPVAPYGVTWVVA